jgi:molybdenum cofactor cytidylyltransferase
MAGAAIVPAAGKGERFGGAKLLARIEDDVLLDRTLRSLLDAGISELVVVTAPGADFGVVTRLADRRVRVIQNPDPSRGMFSSILQGLEAASADPILVLPADMPFVRSATVSSVIAACERTRKIVLPTHHGKHGHPVGLPASIRAALLTTAPDSTLKAELARTGVQQFELVVDDPGVLRDVDLVSDL